MHTYPTLFVSTELVPIDARVYRALQERPEDVNVSNGNKDKNNDSQTIANRPINAPTRLSFPKPLSIHAFFISNIFISNTNLKMNYSETFGKY